MTDNVPSPEAAGCSSLQAAYYADQALAAKVEVISNQEVAQQTFRLRFRDREISKRIRPGQFLMLRIAGTDDPLIGRPLAMYDLAEGEWIDVVYTVMGNMTTRLATLRPGAELEVWGPLGNGFRPHPVDHLVMVAGGIGHTPFLAVAKQQLGAVGYAGEPPQAQATRVSLCYGARTSALLAGVADFQAAGVNVLVATDDGSAGHAGLVTDLLPDLLSGDVRVVCCGPEPMMEAVSAVARQHGVACEVSLETPMACGIGICFSCVTKVRDEMGEWDYKRTCVDGPVFDANRIEW